MSRSKPAPEAALSKLLAWIEQAQKFNETGAPEDRPTDALLIAVIALWSCGFVGAPSLISSGGRNFLRAVLAKPRREGATTRYFDPALVAVILVHCIPGGKISLEPHGADGDFYYLRLQIHGRRADGQRRRVYLLRIAADTQPGHMTREPVDFRSLRRENLTTRRQGAAEGIRARYGTADAKRDTVERVRELIQATPDALPLGLTPDRVAALLDAAYQILGEVPLGEEPV